MILFGGGLVLGSLLSQTGLAAVVGESISDALGVSSLVGITIVVVIVAVLVSETTSNTASAAIMVPIAISIAAAAGVNPTIPALAAIFGANYGFMLPVSTPPNAIVYSSGHAADHAHDQGGGRVRHHRRRPMRGRRDRDGERGGAGVGLRPPVGRLAIAAGAATVVPGFLIGALALQIRADLDVSVAAVASGVTVFFAAGALGAGPGGRLAERVGALRSIRGCLLATAACLVAVAALRRLAARAAGADSPWPESRTRSPSRRSTCSWPTRCRSTARASPSASSSRRSRSAVLVSGLALPLVALPLGLARRPSCSSPWWPWAWPPWSGAARRSFVAPRPRARAPRPSRALVVTAIGAALGSAGPNSLGAYLVASAVDIGIAEGAAGVLAAVGQRGQPDHPHRLRRARRPPRATTASRAVVGLLVAGSTGFALLASDSSGLFVAGAVIAFAIGWGWPGLFNLAVVDLNREAPGAATGVTQTGIYVGAAAGPRRTACCRPRSATRRAWLVSGALCLLAAAAFAAAAAAAAS